jgi:hypothetical protein
MTTLIYRSPEGKAVKTTLLAADLSATTVAQLRAKAAEVSSLAADRVNLLYCGRLLTDDGATLLSQGVRAGGAMVHVIKKPDGNLVAPMGPKTLTDEEMRQFFVAFGMALRNPALNVVIKRLTERENLESLAATCPGLSTDPMALALLSKPEMLLMLLKPEVLQKVTGNIPSPPARSSTLAV